MKTLHIYFIYPLLRRLKLGKSSETCCVNFLFSIKLSRHVRREKPVFLESIFVSKQELITRTSFVYKTLHATGKNFSFNHCPKQRVLHFFSGKLFYESNRKDFSCISIAWHKHSRGWENSRQLCVTVSNSPNTSRVYIRPCKRGKRFLLLKCFLLLHPVYLCFHLFSSV